MKHKRNTKNTLSVRLFTMLLACSLLLAGLPSAVLAGSATEVLRIDFSSEEGYTKGAGATVESGALKLSAVGDSVSLKPLLKVNTNYTFSFKMKNSVADALSMKKDNNFFYYRNGKDTMEAKASNYGFFISGGSFSYIVSKDLTFGAERTGDAANEWREVSVNFTTPWQKAGDTEANVNLCLECGAQDNNLYVDDLVVTETGNKANRVFNGDFEAFDSSKDKILPTSFTSVTTTAIPDQFDSRYYEFVEEDGNHYLRCTMTNGYYPGVISPQAFLAKLDLTNVGDKTDYKFSMKYKQSEIKGSTNAPRFRFNGTAEAGGLRYIRNTQLPQLDSSLADTWVTYSVYLDGEGWIGSKAAESKSSDVYFGHQSKNYCMDDLYLGFDESSIDFHERLDFYEDSTSNSRYFYDSDQTTPPGYTLMSERSIPASSLKDITPDENGNKLVTPRVHYVPTKNAEGTYDEQKITFIAAVYCQDGDNKVLCNMDVAEGTTKDGKTIDIKIDNLEVPVKDGVTYWVEAMAWNGTNFMQPIEGVDKTIFN